MNKTDYNRGIRFYICTWVTDIAAGIPDYLTTIEGAHSRRWLRNQIDNDVISYYHETGAKFTILKIQEAETPMIELEYFAEMFAKYGNKAGREAHEQQTAYVLNLIRTMAARVRINQDEFIER